MSDSILYMYVTKYMGRGTYKSPRLIITKETAVKNTNNIKGTKEIFRTAVATVIFFHVIS